ncbi:hypothetical protein HL658_30950 [Azospirillum sp. RWY-5-1]|uniref:Uncharacterized protein n=1 Tax=Azospirillum oleiclasticum TaxID=2735135 RepID=A0ABX2TN31_9PROT|nr:hypothetical protein [Azospirillum oleiclasticum]NYZ16982.1 hypothetical protein [Azospirillum oleiclasticum]NYZ24575.1 hypothetical protein [Azospirillum oleiclasticum]
MNTNISNASLIRGADGRLFAVSAQGVTEIAEPGASAARSTLRSGDRLGFDAADHEAGRMIITPGM